MDPYCFWRNIFGVDLMEKGEIGKSGDGFVDRSKVRILLCDNDSKSSEEVFTLLCKCSYQGICSSGLLLWFCVIFCDISGCFLFLC